MKKAAPLLALSTAVAWRTGPATAQAPGPARTYHRQLLEELVHQALVD